MAQVILIMLQQIAVGTWSTLALASAAGMLLMVTLSIDEVVAMGQLLVAQRRQGVALWHAFWYGANVDGEDRPSPERTATNRLAASWWGASWPSTLLATAAVGLWLLAAPRSEEHTSELQSLMRISYAVFCLKKTNTQ